LDRLDSLLFFVSADFAGSSFGMTEKAKFESEWPGTAQAFGDVRRTGTRNDVDDRKLQPRPDQSSVGVALPAGSRALPAGCCNAAACWVLVSRNSPNCRIDRMLRSPPANVPNDSSCFSRPACGPARANDGTAIATPSTLSKTTTLSGS
jgi:hypothetical protein